MDSPSTEAILHKFCHIHSIDPKSFRNNYQNCYYPLLQQLVERVTIDSKSQPFIVGLSAPQGAGKTTLVEFFKLVLESRHNLRVVTLSLDDFYKTRAERQGMAEQIHPLFETRGVPGTHDVDLAISTFAALKNWQPASTVQLPHFDKIIDDRAKQSEFRKIAASPDIILFEGWCLNASPQSEKELKQPINGLERELDPKAIWRTYVNKELAGAYQDLFRLIDYSITFYPPSFETVCQWRHQQESHLINSLSALELTNNLVMNPKEIDKFMMHFERISRHHYIDIRRRTAGAQSYSRRIQLDKSRNTTLML